MKGEVSPLSYELKPIQILILSDPDKARRVILKSLRDSGMHLGEVERRLGCSRPTLLRWIERLALQETVEELREEALRDGWHHDRRGGRPKGSTVAAGAKPRTAS